MHRYGSLEKVMPVSHPGPLSNPFPRIAEVQTKATKMMELLQLSYNTNVLGIRGFTGEKAKLGVGGTLWSLIQAGYRLLYSIRPIHSGEWTCKRKGANTDPVGKRAEQWTVSRRPMEDPKRSRTGMGDTKAFTIQSVDRGDSIAPAAYYCLPFVLVLPGFNLSLAEDRLSLFIETYEKYSLCA